MVSFSLQQDRTLSRHSNCTKTKFIHKSSNAPLKVDSHDGNYVQFICRVSLA